MLKEPVNVNRFAQQGVKFSDNDFIETFGLDPALAGKEELNTVMYNLMYDKNVKHMQQYEGMTEKQAKVEAGRMRKEAKS